MTDEVKHKRRGKIIVFKGLPGSGKSTRARELMRDGNIMRVNRDEIRRMLFSKWKGKKEHVVTEIETSAITHALSEGYDVVVDDTNLSLSSQSRWKNLADKLGVPLVEESFNTPIEECVERDFLREGSAHVGRAVIENMALRYNLLPKLEPDKQVVIFDIDGTLADQTKRRKYIERTPKDYNNYYSQESLLGDKPIWPVIWWANSCYDAGYYVLIVSGRPNNRAGDSTDQWLRNFGVCYHHIFMRAGDDFRDDTIIKQEILDKILRWIPKEQILFTVDDRKRIVDMWRRNGIKCYPVPEDGVGDF